MQWQGLLRQCRACATGRQVARQLSVRAGLGRSGGLHCKPAYVVAAGGILCGGAFAAVQYSQSECAAAERRTDYVVIGGGLSAMGGVRGLRQMDKDGLVVVVSPSPSPSFSGSQCEGMDCVDFCALEATDLVHTDFDKTRAVELDVDGQRVVLSDGRTVHYTKGCLIASDAHIAERPLRTIADSALDRVHMMGDARAMQEVRDTVKKAQENGDNWHVTVMGGSAEACAMSTSLVAQGAIVTQICEEKAVLGHAIPHYLGNHLMWLMKRMGVDLMPYSHMQYCRVVQRETADGNTQDLCEVFVRKSYDRLDVRKLMTNLLLVFPSHTTRTTDLVSERNGLEVASDGGIQVNGELCARSRVYVAGPSANVPHPLFGRMGLEGEEDAWASGECAGRNMAGDHALFSHVSQKVSCRLVGQDGVNLQVIGKTDDSLDTVGFWAMGRWADAPASDVTLETAPTPESYVAPDESVRATATVADKALAGVTWAVSSVAGAATAATAAATTYADAPAQSTANAPSMPPPPAASSRRSGMPAEPDESDEFLQVAPRSGVVYFLQMPEHLSKGHQIERQRGRVVGAALLNMPPDAAQTARRLIAERRYVRDEEELRRAIAVDKCDSGRKSIKRTTQGKSAVNSRNTARAPALGTSNDKWTRAIFGTLPHER